MTTDIYSGRPLSLCAIASRRHALELCHSALQQQRLLFTPTDSFGVGKSRKSLAILLLCFLCFELAGSLGEPALTPHGSGRGRCPVWHPACIAGKRIREATRPTQVVWASSQSMPQGMRGLPNALARICASEKLQRFLAYPGKACFSCGTPN